jgi:hypothetical protein
VIALLTEWLDIGRAMYRLDPERFAAFVAHARQLLDGYRDLKPTNVRQLQAGAS